MKPYQTNHFNDTILDAAIKNCVTEFAEAETERLEQSEAHTLSPAQNRVLKHRLLQARKSKRPHARIRSWKTALVAVLTASILIVGTLEAFGFDTILSPLIGFVQNLTMQFSLQQQTQIVTDDNISADVCYQKLNEKAGGGLIVPAWMPEGTRLKDYSYQEAEQRAKLVFEFPCQDNRLGKLRIDRQPSGMYHEKTFRMELKDNKFDSTGEPATILGQDAIRYHMVLESGDTCTAIVFQNGNFVYTVELINAETAIEAKILDSLKMY